MSFETEINIFADKTVILLDTNAKHYDALHILSHVAVVALQTLESLRITRMSTRMLNYLEN